MIRQSEDARLSPAQDRMHKIRSLNDGFRKGMGSGRVMLTQGIVALGDAAVASVMLAVQEFDGFSTDNDPYGEHDFGSFEHAGERMFWKIDYYDSDCLSGSPDPSDPAVTTRVMTVMLAGEY
ncbi:MAG: DUF3768 domain-containing protein [Blastomonas sp.]|uniref:DUF3768 domain-containing protein n=1 Tax=Blastomonas sp. TaxID=1909299 RepID=UPI00258C7316|nr:DUF3768 domain-containing protein [Blastomonas sp.]MCO5792664.1 DUF3768 domain-containing protein [Blastomonas sp.]